MGEFTMSRGPPSGKPLQNKGRGGEKNQAAIEKDQTIGGKCHKNTTDQPLNQGKT